MLFSRRNKFKKARDSVQLESLDEITRNHLWSAYNELVFRQYEPESRYGGHVRGSNLEGFVLRVWVEVFHQPTDTIPLGISKAVHQIRQLHFSGDWHTVFDILEALAATLPRQTDPAGFVSMVNTIFEREAVGYRLLRREVVQITDQEELRAIDAAMEAAPSPVRIHLRDALQHLANRKEPDYRNSIKESILAVESVARLVVGSNATLGQLLKHMSLHPALEKGLSAIYGYTSDADGIRHGLMDEPSVTATDAKFFLVVCSAFVHYALEKARP